ncbi:hypothetical protein KIH39_23150 [Telmatocola sphagniphila]|uniref:Uncharacterized protein n=1 Tax=Telmatocola sphagniphila TaxID=1123043 RepID=A0A8E6EXV4_9BACT|nr:hypothetical protein [Telmatocola sphagniphila]QVL31706.1 hypothetical protein KIH39_23150 [Telmatocola sphagniphila]
MRVIEDDPNLLEKLRDRDYPGRVERVILFTLEAWDINCQQHIHKRYSERQLVPLLEPLRSRIRELEAEWARMRKGMSGVGTK